MKKIIFQLLYLIIFSFQVSAQNTVGLIKKDTSHANNGYILFTPYECNRTYLINKEGKLIHFWTSQFCMTRTPYLLPDGTLLITVHDENLSDCPAGGVIEKLDWEGNVMWNYIIADSVNCQHHDICPLPNGNILVSVSVNKTIKEAIDAGRNPLLLGSKLQSEKILELRPVGNNSAEIVWEWDLWEHIIQDIDLTKSNFGSVEQHPELINLNYTTHYNSDEWIHLNSIDYNPVLDQILLSSLFFNEIWIIDHSTSKEQSSSHKGGRSGKGGDLLYRWGNPATYNNGNSSQQKLFGQHNAQWIKKGSLFEGGIMLYNNGINRPGIIKYSDIEIIKPLLDKQGNYQMTRPFLPVSPVWIYGDSITSQFYSPNYSSAQMLPEGHVLICVGISGQLFEIDSLKNIVWEYYNPVGKDGPVSQGTKPKRHTIFRCNYYPPDYPGLNNKRLSPGATIELPEEKR